MATYSVLATIRNYSGFSDRCAIAVATFAKYIIDQGAPYPSNYKRQFLWATNAVLSPSSVVSELANVIVQDPAFTNLTSTADFDALPDSTIQSVVEATINATLLAY